MTETLVLAGKNFLLSFALSALLTPLMIWAARSFNMVAQPREDRWHKRPTALFGGVAMFTAFIIPFSLNFFGTKPGLVMIVGLCAMFLVGLIDDLFELTPQGKFLSQIAISAFMAAGGLELRLGIPVVSILLSIFWFVVLTNALNILDNMDGLCAGITLVASISFFVFGLLNPAPPLFIQGAVMLAGTALGFLLYNFYPARIFMGDAGSLFLGSSLAMLSIVGTWGHANSHSAFSQFTGITNLMLVLMVPVAMLIVPIFDTALVSFSRPRHGRSIFQGGKDHTSHRLVLLGLSEPKAVLMLMLWAASISAVTIMTSIHSKEGLLVIFTLFAIFAVFFGVFLSHQTDFLYGPASDPRRDAGERYMLLRKMLNKKQILQAAVDTILISLAYIASYLLRFEGRLDPYNLELIERSLPIMIAVKITCFWIFGLYRGQWRYVGIWDLFQLTKAIVISALITTGIFLGLYRFQGYSRIVFINDAILTFLFVGGVRLLLRLFKEYFEMEREGKNTTPILIIGAGDGGELFLRELRKNPNHDYLPVGFIDDDKAKKGQIIHGVKVLGDTKDLSSICRRHGIKKVFIAIMSISDTALKKFYDTCKVIGVECIKVPSLLPPKKGANKDAERIEEKKLVRFRAKRRGQ